MSVERLKAVEEALHKVQEQNAALEDLSEQLSLSVHVLEAEVAGLARELRERPAQSAVAAQTHVPVAAESQGGQGAGEREGPPRSADADGARLVALDMALKGETRSTTERYLEEHFALKDIEGLLEGVYKIAANSRA
jgi:hypothetical protein